MALQNIAIVGAGIVGRLLAWRLSREKISVTLFEKDTSEIKNSCSHVCGGMLAPYFEREIATPFVTQLGEASLELWQDHVNSFSEKVFFQRNGTLVVTHRQDETEWQRLKNKLQDTEISDQISVIEQNQIRSLEPELMNFSKALYAPEEGQIDVHDLLRVLYSELQKNHVDLRFSSFVDEIEPFSVNVNGQKSRFDLVIDTRGFHANKELPSLRGVRGELIVVQANEVSLHRPIRLMHPRHPVYVIPRSDQIFLIGATSLENQDPKPVTVRSALELLSAAFTLHSGFAEASILELQSGLRPAFPDNEPRIFFKEGLLRINGLYRHGALVSPKIVESVRDYLFEKNFKTEGHPLFFKED